ncbi:protein S100-P-like [Brienomyrus brachyistius]|uniref:protein S100-P-like n=1 Tax=Brienomyrus brachyistius TaxID=42636 RepID=UPI0020B284B2|nr:protein S100-P-like [Brienomyrus brachyistius]
MANSTQLEMAMAMLMSVFDKYAMSEGKKDMLSKSELRSLMEKELPGFLKNPKEQAEVDKLMKDLDHNGDSEVDFSEYVVFIAALTCACHSRPKKK